jgi:hypothetical protein
MSSAYTQYTKIAYTNKPACGCTAAGKTSLSLVLTTAIAWLLRSKASLTSLAIYRQSMFGSLDTLPSALPNLQYLDLSFNYLVGTVPSWSWYSPLVALNLSNNFLSGTLPAGLPGGSSNLPLTVILDNNMIGGEGADNPTTCYSTMHTLDAFVAVVMHRGTLYHALSIDHPAWPALRSSCVKSLLARRTFMMHAGGLLSAWGWRTFKKLSLSSNSFVGTLPSLWYQLVAHADQLQLNNNTLVGAFPKEWLATPTITSFQLSIRCDACCHGLDHCNVKCVLAFVASCSVAPSINL